MALGPGFSFPVVAWSMGPCPQWGHSQSSESEVLRVLAAKWHKLLGVRTLFPNPHPPPRGSKSAQGTAHSCKREAELCRGLARALPTQPSKLQMQAPGWRKAFSMATSHLENILCPFRVKSTVFPNSAQEAAQALRGAHPRNRLHPSLFKGTGEAWGRSAHRVHSTNSTY